MAGSTVRELEQRLTEVEHQLAHLQGLERAGGAQAPEGVRAARASERVALKAELDRLEAQLERASGEAGAPAPAGWPGLWEPLALHEAPAAQVPATAPAPASAPAPPGRAARAREALLEEAAELYDDVRWVRRTRLQGWVRELLAESEGDAAVFRVVCAAAEDLCPAGWLEVALGRRGLAPPRRPLAEPPPPPAPPVPDAGLPDAEGLTHLQRLALETWLFTLPAGDRLPSLGDVARHLAAGGRAATPEALEASLVPLTEAGGARYPLLVLRAQPGGAQVQLTELGSELLVPDASGRRLQPALPLLLLEGFAGPPAMPPHHLGEVADAAQQVLRRGSPWWPFLPDPAEGGLMLQGDLGHLHASQATLETRAELRACRPPGALTARLTVARPLVALPEAELGARLAGALASGELDPCTWTIEASGAFTVELAHLAFLSRLVRWLELQGLVRRRLPLEYRTRRGDGEPQLEGRAGFLRHFLAGALEREASRRAGERARLVRHQGLARALVIGAFLHPVVDTLVVEADTPEDARWALRHLHDGTVWARAPFDRRADAAAKLGPLRQALEAAHPELAAQLAAGLGEEEAEALRTARQLGARREELLRAAGQTAAALRAFDEADARQAQVDAVCARLAALGARHADARRTRVATLDELLPGIGFTPPLTPCG